GLLIAGESISRQGRHEESLALFEQIQEADCRTGVTAHCARGRILLTSLFRLGDAERAYRAPLDAGPGTPGPRLELSYILGLQGRSWEAIPFRVELLRQGRFDIALLLSLALGTDADDENPEVLARFTKAVPNDAQVLCAASRAAMRENQTARALV